MDAGIFFRHQAELVLRHQMHLSNYFVKFFYSVLYIPRISLPILLQQNSWTDTGSI